MIATIITTWMVVMVKRLDLFIGKPSSMEISIPYKIT